MERNELRNHTLNLLLLEQLGELVVHAIHVLLDQDLLEALVELALSRRMQDGIATAALLGQARLDLPHVVADAVGLDKVRRLLREEDLGAREELALERLVDAQVGLLGLVLGEAERHQAVDRALEHGGGDLLALARALDLVQHGLGQALLDALVDGRAPDRQRQLLNATTTEKA